MVKVAVIGAGYLGRFHIEKFKRIKSAKLVAVCEINKEVKNSLESEFAVPVVDDYKKLIGKVDAVSIVTPTPSHYEIANFFLSKGVHLFIEKPVTDDINSARKLLSLREKDTVVQVGYIERFNPAFKMLKEDIFKSKPHTVIFKRKAPFSPRGADVDVVFDLMIHDIDLAFNIFSEKPKILSVNGEKIFTDYNDVVVAVIKFGDILACFEISRVSSGKERKITVLGEGNLLEADLIDQTFRIIKDKEEKVFTGEKKDILYEELSDFIKAVEEKKDPKVTLEDGLSSLHFAQKILKKIRK